jgi:hypothetical protein
MAEIWFEAATCCCASTSTLANTACGNCFASRSTAGATNCQRDCITSYPLDMDHTMLPRNQLQEGKQVILFLLEVHQTLQES